MYGLTGVHVPLVPRDRRYEVNERLDHQGNVLVPLDEAELTRLGDDLKEAGVEAVIISFFHAYANTAHEDRARDILAAINPAWEIVTATSVVREYYEFERTSTAVVNAYVAPVMRTYLQRLQRGLQGIGITAPLLVVNSDGAAARAEEAARRPVAFVGSGPAAGVAGWGTSTSRPRPTRLPATPRRASRARSASCGSSCG